LSSFNLFKRPRWQSNLGLRCLRGLCPKTELIIMPIPSQSYGQQGPSCWDRTKIGFGLGFCVGMTSGFLFGGFTALRYGMRGRELMSNVGKTMVQGGGTFGTFMAIGSAIRC